MSPLAVGSAAPDFSLLPAPAADPVTLSGLRGHTVVLLFFPLAFSRVCTAEMCRMAEDWSSWNQVGARVFGISVDSPWVNVKFAAETGVPFPILSDFNKEAAVAFDVLYPDFRGLKGVSKRAAFVVDREGRVAYAWVSDDSGVMPPLDQIREAAAKLG